MVAVQNGALRSDFTGAADAMPPRRRLHAPSRFTLAFVLLSFTWQQALNRSPQLVPACCI